MSLKMKTVQAKYQLKSGILIQCSVEVEDISKEEARVYVGIKRRGDTLLPEGTVIFLNPQNNILEKDETESPYRSFETLSIQVQSHQYYTGEKEAIHICTPLKQENFRNRREIQRGKTNSHVTLKSETYRIVDGTLDGLTLVKQSEHPITALNLNATYPFHSEHKGQKFVFKGTIKHILYNWKTFEHRIGVQLNRLPDRSHEIVLKILLDPDYKVDLCDASVNAAIGKVGRS